MEMEAAGLAALLEEGSGPPARYPWLHCVCAKRHGAHVECVKRCLNMSTWRWGCFLWALTAGLTLALTGCVVALMLPPRATAGDVEKWRTCTTSHCVQAVSSMWEALNSSGDPCEDFYGFSCGRWLQGSGQPTGKPHWGTWQELDKNNQFAMHRFLENATIKETDAERKVQRFYLSCLSSSRSRLGSRSLSGIISQLGGWHGGHPTTTTTTGATTGDAELQQLLQLLGRNFSLGAFFKLGVGSLPFDFKQRALGLSVPDLGLPSPDYYLNKTANDKVLTTYLDFMIRVRQLLGGVDERAASDMRLVLELESRLAGIMALTGSNRNPGFITFRDLQDMSPFLDWTQYFHEVFYPLPTYSQRTVLIDNKEYFHSAFDLVNNTDRRVLRLYALWSLVRQLLPSLDGRYEDAKQDLMVAIHGADNVESRARWEFCVEETNRALPLGLGALYARATFNETQRRMAEDIVTRIRNAFVSNLDSVAWMDGKTRAAAKEKSMSIKFQVGYPQGMLEPGFLDRLYANVTVSGSLFENTLELYRTRRETLQQQLSVPVDNNDNNRWSMNPQTANAYYSPEENTVVLPAALFQPPLFHGDFPMAVNFGKIGVVIGHEVTHAFDDQGRRFDGQGRMRTWWSSASLAAFKQRSDCLVELYERWAAGGEERFSGRQTLGENVADLGGIKTAFRAYEMWTEERGEEAFLPVRNLTDRQIFFTAFSQVWCSTETAEDRRRQLLLRDTHSPARLRTLASLSNSAEFAATFNCPAASPMNPRNKCDVW
ncbi:endothelin-converting enzyme 1 isoform X2 [Petromyzon marinus]|uniref:Endothelin-converting enzyme 1-like isoform X2 n=1 Tax=Petromyzon marinus TaxID=7757 RepID=A0AAJ7T6D1_PETMA|nr:endothelin-converting enzyme 1-like isoform X2 [Petromyzon marinus]